MNDPLDCLVIGGGPAGLTAAIYLARFHLEVCVIDAGDGRAALIPMTRNHAGFPDGIAGAELLRRMQDQAARYGAIYQRGTVHAVRKDHDIFVATTADGEVRARSVLLATGVVNNRPDIDGALHDDALRRGLLRYCPICDGYELTDRPVGVVGTGEHGTKEALFVRSFTADLSLISPETAHELTPLHAAALAEAGVRLVEGPCLKFVLADDHIKIDVPAGEHVFASIYLALGSIIRSDLAVRLSANTTDEGCLVVDAHQRTSVAGLYAAGDVVQGLDQISHAMGEGGVAATTIRNDLAQRTPLRRTVQGFDPA
ncbi:MAG: NAD(P)/FAD-dependent oxidoreductase [Candidatus Sphingomonas colombiensis]|nr:NAD(P)/FAD-dependent oxidoreductase [Sphingomonas sp.]WEK43391.1 MAG: NAD(P)/FAD-dependent oxidoreductase [Sphingomonas sp.]